jgi:hypothetical protein
MTNNGIVARAWSWSSAAALTLVLIPRPGFCAAPIHYSGTLPDGGGKQVAVTFDGEIEGSSLTGTVILGGTTLSITGSVAADGSVSGKLVSGGASVGTFQAQPGQQGVGVTYNYAGKSGSVTISGATGSGG